jgi:hypothetical protein
VTRLGEQVLGALGNMPEQFAATLEVEQDKWKRLVEDRQLSLE